MNILLENKKISQATHNILAYRIKTDSGSILQVSSSSYGDYVCKLTYPLNPLEIVLGL